MNWKSIEFWLYGLASAFIGGFSSALAAYVGGPVAKDIGIDVKPLDLKQSAMVAVSAGIISAAFYLKQSPLPKINGNGNGQAKPVEETTASTKQ